MSLNCKNYVNYRQQKSPVTLSATGLAVYLKVKPLLWENIPSSRTRVSKSIVSCGKAEQERRPRQVAYCPGL